MSSHQKNRKAAETEEAASTNGGVSIAARPARYVYRDFSRVPPDEGESVLVAITHSISTASDVKHQKLPIKLDALLRDPELSHIISWLPHGRAWRILKPKQFVKEVLSKYFDYCNYNSFVRLINAWGFRRLSSGPDRHAYYHELFLKDMPHLHSRMRRVTGKDEKPPIDQDDEPDLYRISQAYPVPPSSGSLTASSQPPPVLPPFAPAAGSSAATNTFGYSSYRNRAYPSSSSSVAPAVAPLHSIHENSGHFNASAPVGIAVNSPTFFNPYAALAAQFQQSSAEQQRQQQQSYCQFLNAASSMPFQSGMVPSYAQSTSTAQHQFRQQYDMACLSSLLQGAVRGSTVTSTGHPRRPPATNSSGETPIMYIPVYPSTLAGLGAGGVPSQDIACRDDTILHYN